jgi:TPR repeat protein
MNRLSAQLFSSFALCSCLAGSALGADTLTEAQNAYAAGNYAKAFELYTPLAKKDAKAQLSLGTMYYIGQGVTQSYTDAAKLFERSAKQGNVLAQDILGEMYDQGLGVPQDYKTAAKWYRLAAEQGDATGQYNLGLMYARELGLPQDDVLGYMWMSLSGLHPEELEFVARQMTPGQIGKAHELADQCTAKGFKNC